MAPAKAAGAAGSAPAAPKSATAELLDTLEEKFRLTTKQQELLIRVATLLLIYILAFATRLFSVLRYESVIHEFDPYFNYRTTLYLTRKGFYEFWNWFDHETWYPLGRIIGFTLYPGLMVTSAVIYWALHALSLVVHIRDVCVMTAPFFASNTAMVAYFFGKEIRDSGTGLIAAIFLAICPGYISRSVAGSYDYECIAIFAMILTFFLFVKAVNTGSLAWAAGAALTYFYMAASWGGYIFIINLIPIYVVVLLITGRYTPRLYIAYNAFYIIGMLLAMQIRFIGFQHVQSSEHMAALGTFCLIQVFYFVDWVKHQLADPKLFRTFLRVVVFSFGGVGSLAFAVGMATAPSNCLTPSSPNPCFSFVHHSFTFSPPLPPSPSIPHSPLPLSPSPPLPSPPLRSPLLPLARLASSPLPLSPSRLFPSPPFPVSPVFGGVTGYSSDDINKLHQACGWFLWMVRIGGGVFPDIKEPDYLNNGDYRTDANGSPKMLNCLMYKMCYYRFGELQTEYGKPTGWDRARGYEIGNKDIELEYIEEAFTSSNWIVRIYRVKQPDNRW
ncbi:unnamed protein product [Closterium sp. Naga37s-1]|nr:unnamed protein product [Closterium sp. Naga37s-1]